MIDRLRAVAFLAALIAMLAAANWVGAHKVQRHLDRTCAHGIATACALNGRR